MTEARRPSLQPLVGTSKVVVCVGPGGVGKTSLSATIALHAAHTGARAIVLTIDPAKRLAQALGLPEIGNEERIVSSATFEERGLMAPKGQLSAMMLDVKRTWDEVVMRYHPDPEQRQLLLKNRLYVALSTALAGSQEYMAMEKLYELSTRKEDPLDLVVLDTPPASNALDFLEAPSKILNALDNDATRWFLKPYEPATAKGVKSKLVDAGSAFFVKTIGRFVGTEAIEELAALLTHFSGMYDGFRHRAKVVRRLLADPGTSFVVVSTPTPGPLDSARSFLRRLEQESISAKGFLLNRATEDPFLHRAPSPAALEAAVASISGPKGLTDKLLDAAEHAHRAALTEAEIAQSLREKTKAEVVVVPELSDDVHDLAALDTLRHHVFDTL